MKDSPPVNLRFPYLHPSTINSTINHQQKSNKESTLCLAWLAVPVWGTFYSEILCLRIFPRNPQLLSLSVLSLSPIFPQTTEDFTHQDTSPPRIIILLVKVVASRQIHSSELGLLTYITRIINLIRKPFIENSKFIHNRENSHPS